MHTLVQLENDSENKRCSHFIAPTTTRTRTRKLLALRCSLSLAFNGFIYLRIIPISFVYYLYLYSYQPFKHPLSRVRACRRRVITFEELLVIRVKIGLRNNLGVGVAAVNDNE